MRYLSDRVMVMYLGHVVELGITDQVFSPPYHPYTEALLSAVPIADTSVKKKHIVLEGSRRAAITNPRFPVDCAKRMCRRCVCWRTATRSNAI